MRKYIVSILLSLTVGFFLSKSFLEQYNGYNNSKSISSNGVIGYFVKYGEYSSIEEMEKNTTALTNYIYNQSNDKYIVYIGITLDKNNLKKMMTYFNDIGYNVTSEEFVISDKNYLNFLKNADKLLLNTTDYTVLGEVISQILFKYEEFVINDDKN